MPCLSTFNILFDVKTSLSRPHWKAKSTLSSSCRTLVSPRRDWSVSLASIGERLPVSTSIMTPARKQG
eukprot:1135310-Amphidinium_carterae.1